MEARLQVAIEPVHARHPKAHAVGPERDPAALLAPRLVVLLVEDDAAGMVDGLDQDEHPAPVRRDPVRAGGQLGAAATERRHPNADHAVAGGRLPERNDVARVSDFPFGVQAAPLLDREPHLSVEQREARLTDLGVDAERLGGLLLAGNALLRRREREDVVAGVNE